MSTGSTIDTPMLIFGFGPATLGAPKPSGRNEVPYEDFGFEVLRHARR